MRATGAAISGLKAHWERPFTVFAKAGTLDEAVEVLISKNGFLFPTYKLAI